jgi:hypothetical protein
MEVNSAKSRACSRGELLTDVTTSPALIPALAAGLPGGVAKIARRGAAAVIFVTRAPIKCQSVSPIDRSLQGFHSVIHVMSTRRRGWGQLGLIGRSEITVLKRRKIVAIVDDDPSMLRAAADLLDANGFATEEFTSAENFSIVGRLLKSTIFSLTSILAACPELICGGNSRLPVPRFRSSS